MSRHLYTESFGYGPDLVMLHGWAMNGGLFGEFANHLAGQFRVTRVDLPGHGYSETSNDFSLEGIAESLLQAVPDSASWLGWSLGALPVIHMARHHPDRVARLVLMAGTPRFTATDEWPGVDARLLEQMAGQLEEDFRGTLKRFIGLQTLGQPDARSLARWIDARVYERPLPQKAALRGGLNLLKNSDLRADLVQLSQPVMALLGARDRLVPARLASALKSLKPEMAIESLPMAAHLPFLTHAQESSERVSTFLSG